MEIEISCSELVRAPWQLALMFHPVQQLGRAVCVRRDNHLAGCVSVVVEMRRTLHPTGVTSMYFEAAARHRFDLVDFVQFENLSAALLCKVKIVHRKFV